MRVAIVQMLVGKDKDLNVKSAVNKIGEAAKNGAELVILPECFNSPYGTNFFQQYSEPIPDGETCLELAEAAKLYKVFIVGGTIPELVNGRLYNTCPTFAPTGQLIAKYRKMHLFDIDIPGKIAFKESEILSAGSEFSTFSMGKLKFGLGICYDLRFPEFATVLGEMGCHVMVLPSAFNTTTGPLHWHLLARGRAVDTQSFVILASPARNVDASYPVYGHSLIISPMGEILAEAGEGEEIIWGELDIKSVEEMRRNIPSLRQKRTDIYTLPTLL